MTSSCNGISACLCDKSTKSTQKKDIVALPFATLRSRINNVKKEARFAFLLPKTAKNARPPSRRPTGSKFAADTIKPVKPTINNGCTGMGCESGSIMAFGANLITRAPTKNDDFMSPAGTNGIFSSWFSEELVVITSPEETSKHDSSIVTAGPLRAMSNSTLRDFGNERN